MIEYINSHLPGFWIALGFTLLAMEVLLFGFTTIILLFSGMAAITTGLLMMLGLLPETWLAGMACFGVSTGIYSLLLWKVLQKLQISGKPSRKPTSDLIGYEFVLQEDVTATNPGQHRYSGILWKVENDHKTSDTLPAGQRVKVTSVDVGVMRVQAVDV